MDNTLPTTDLVLVGAGHTNMHIVRMWRMKPIPGVKLTVVSPFGRAAYSGMLPGTLAGLYKPDDMMIDLFRFTAGTGMGPNAIRLIAEEAARIDPERRRIHFKNRPEIRYDICSIGIGSVPAGRELWMRHDRILSIKPMPTFLPRLEKQLDLFRQKNSGEPIRISVVGGGAAGTEVAFCLEARLRQQDVAAQVSLVDAGPSILKGYIPGLIKKAESTFKEKGIPVVSGQRVREYDNDNSCLLFESGDSYPADLVVWATAAAAPPALEGFDLPKTDRGFLAVRRTLQTTADARVFVVGDTAAIVDDPVPRAGVYAVREGPVLWKNIQRMLQNQPLVNYEPQRGFLSLLATGDGRAIGQYKGRVVSGKIAWKWKNYIDKKFMRMYQDYSVMGMAELPTAEKQSPVMKCRGCGGKVGGGVLSAVFERLEIPSDPNVLQGLDQPDDSAILNTAKPVDVLSVDFFQAFLDDPYIVGRIAALNSLSDLWASGSEPAAALAIVGIPAGEPGRQAELLFQLLSGSLEELNRAGCTLVGGHTIESSEITIGFTVLGRLNGQSPFRKSGMRPGDQLILTKPLGTGILLAGNMQAQARAEWMTAGLKIMLQNSAAISGLARDNEIAAVTDVTGFGLAGHLHEMLAASQCSAQVRLDALPLYNGVIDLISQGILSTLDNANRGVEHFVTASDEQKQRPEYSVLFDPQTSGGTLLSVPKDKAAPFLETGGWVIGEVVESDSTQIVVV